MVDVQIENDRVVHIRLTDCDEGLSLTKNEAKQLLSYLKDLL